MRALDFKLILYLPAHDYSRVLIQSYFSLRWYHFRVVGQCRFAHSKQMAYRSPRRNFIRTYS